jgi:hypothetical protein
MRQSYSIWAEESIMASPFPGMDPYIESSGYWGDFHLSMNVAIRDEINRQLPEGFAASVDQYVWVHEPAGERTHSVKPDVYVSELAPRGRTTTAVKTIKAPRRITLPAPERRQHRFVKIEDLEAKRVVTFVELLSPTNKRPGDDRVAYLCKRGECHMGRASLVEIDLLRGGVRMPLSSPPPKLSDYYVMACRSWEYPEAEFWTFGIRDRLPVVTVPIVAEVRDLSLSLADCVNRVYDLARYAAKLDYRKHLRPTLRKSDVVWAQQLLASRRGSTRS